MPQFGPGFDPLCPAYSLSTLPSYDLFQGAETSGTGAGANQLAIDFPVEHIQALVVSHVHIGRCRKLRSALPGSIYIAIAPAFALPVGTHTGMHSSRKHFHQHRQYLAMVARIEAPHRACEPGEVQGDLVRST